MLLLEDLDDGKEAARMMITKINSIKPETNLIWNFLSLLLINCQT